MPMEQQKDSAYIRNLQLINNLFGKETDTESQWSKLPGRILIISNSKSVQSENGQYAFCMALNLLCRLYPIVTEIGLLITKSSIFTVNTPLFAKGAVVDSVNKFICNLKPDCQVKFLDKLSDDWDATLSIGVSQQEKNVISISSDGWTAYISPNNDVPEFSTKTNAIGAYVASCIGGMEVFKKVMLKKINFITPEKSEYDIRWQLRLLDEKLQFSAFDYKVDGSYNPDLPRAIDLGKVHVFGVGAGGGAAMFTIASLSQLTNGNVNLFDPDVIKPSNLNRCIFATRQHVELPKVEVIKNMFDAFPTLQVNAKQTSYQKLSSEGGDSNIDLLISTVDTKDTRRALQWSLPRVILDAAVLLTNFYVRRIRIGIDPCFSCTHTEEEATSLNAIISKVTCLPLNDVIELRSTNARFTEDQLRTMLENSKRYGFTMPSINDRFSDWCIMHCSQLKLPNEERVPLPFAAVLAGVLIAGEV